MLKLMIFVAANIILFLGSAAWTRKEYKNVCDSLASSNIDRFNIATLYAGLFVAYAIIHLSIAISLYEFL